MKRQANMASRTSSAEKRAIPLADFAADIERRRQETGITNLPRNSGKRRTESKKALLDAIDAITEKQGWRW